jgi:hypothetical protein
MFFKRLKPPVTDDEFVERLRRQMSFFRKFAIVECVGCGIVMLAMVYFGVSFWRKMVIFSDSEAASSGYRFGLMIGGTFGLFWVLFLWRFMASLSMALGPNYFRLHRLLFKYHDVVSKLREERHESENQS